MKLKLSISTATPIELGHQIDAIINKKIKKHNYDLRNFFYFSNLYAWSKY